MLRGTLQLRNLINYYRLTKQEIWFVLIGSAKSLDFLPPCTFDISTKFQLTNSLPFRERVTKFLVVGMSFDEKCLFEKVVGESYSITGSDEVRNGNEIQHLFCRYNLLLISVLTSSPRQMSSKVSDHALEIARMFLSKSMNVETANLIGDPIC